MLIQFQFCNVSDYLLVRLGVSVGEINTVRVRGRYHLRAAELEHQRKRKSCIHRKMKSCKEGPFVAAAGTSALTTNMDVLSYALMHLRLRRNCGIVSIYCMTLPSLPSPSVPPLFPGIGCSLQVHQVLYISHQL